ncbi:MAG TPA: hypothetical protein VFA30_10325 [Gaiellaceae bacterium]|nr:hypothetical protein [Gaiellaceae bacterium]
MTTYQHIEQPPSAPYGPTNPPPFVAATIVHTTATGIRYLINMAAFTVNDYAAANNLDTATAQAVIDQAVAAGTVVAL